MKYFVARQPIFDRQMNVYGYELLFRSGFNNIFTAMDEDKASSDVITTSFMVIGLEELTSGKKAFINFTHNLLVNDVATLFPKHLLTVEMLESITVDDEVVNACRKLKDDGFQLVFDDFTFAHAENPLIEYADIIKVDFLQNTIDEREVIPRKFASSNVKFLAEKVETRDDYKQALDWNYSYFQGYFLSKPAIKTGYAIPASKIVYLRILKEINKADVDFSELENIIKMDVSLSYKLLRFINSAFWGLKNEISSIRHAISLLGVRELKKWISLVALSNLAEDKPKELIQTSLVRAKMCEELAGKLGRSQQRSEFFMMGLLSLVDVIMDKPMEEVLANLPILEDIKCALTGEENYYRTVFDIVKAYENANWDEFTKHIITLDLDEKAIPPMYFDALKWINQVFNSQGAVLG
ncbi:HDOD domain-containing protein [candidate division KSB1 bacterium]|nr:HDOD domain-containing protein [candidate division KSB1 bacterium]